MDQQPENFENLRRLLALKRYEQPPPGYFESFSHDIFLRLQGGESDQPIGWERMEWEAPWLQRLWEALSLKPYLSGAVGVAACAMVVAGVLYAERPNLPLAEGEATPAILTAPDTTTALAAFNQPIGTATLAAVTNTPSIQPNMPSGLFGTPSLHVERATRPFGAN